MNRGQMPARGTDAGWEEDGKKKILVTGAGGFIGSALTAYLRERGVSVLGPGSGALDVTDPAAVDGLPACDLRHIVHLAGKTFVPKSWEEPGDFLRTNMLGTLHMLELCRKWEISMTYISAYIYGRPERIPIRETDRINPNNSYAKSKYMAEELCRFYAEQYGVRVSVIRPFNVYGAGQRKDYLIPQIISQAIHEDAVTVMDLMPGRDYIYLDDLLEAIWLTVEHVQDYDVFNIGLGVSYTVEEVIDTVQRLLGTRRPVVCKNKARRNELDNVVADISHAREVLGWQPTHTLEEGLGKMIARMQETDERKECP